MLLAAALILAAVPLAPDTPTACETGQARFNKGDFTGAQDPLWQCVIAGAEDRTPGFDLALTYRELKNYDSGLARAESALKNSPANVDSLYVAAFLNFRRQDNARSMLLLSRADRLDHSDWRLHQVFALNYAVFKMFDSAAIEFQRAIALNPANAELRYQLARLYFTQGRYPESIELSKAALAIYPDYPEVYDNLGLAYEGSGDATRAASNFQQAIALNQKYGRADEWPLIDYAMFFLQQGTPQASVPLLNQALQFNPKSSKANYELGRAMRVLGHDDEAEKYFEKALEIDPSNASACFALAPLVRRHGDNRRAQELLARFNALREHPNTAKAGSEPLAAR